MTALEELLGAAASLVDNGIANDDELRRHVMALLAEGNSPHVLQLLREVPRGEVLIVLRKREV